MSAARTARTAAAAREQAAETVRKQWSEVDAVRESAQLGNINMIASTFVVSPRFFTPLGPGETMPALGFGLNVEDLSFRVDTGVATAFFDWQIWATDSGDFPKGTSATHLFISCRYAVAYKGMQGRDARAVEHFVDQVGEFATFPYFRAHVATLAGAAGLLLPPLPVITTERRPKRLAKRVEQAPAATTAGRGPGKRRSKKAR